jgi:hypothetical protein
VSKKTVCNVPPLWNLAEYARHRCDDSSHSHLSRPQVLRYELQGRVRWLRRADLDGNGAVVRLTAAAPGSVIDRVAIRGASCRVGETLVVAAARGQSWARVMLAHIALRVRDSNRDACLSE